ncbi:MAG: HAD-IA family hydrolase [Chloroflexota bacterium]|nr:MAG: HAD-IA family hydrolase [Chloroflexota bacterium]
MDLILLLDLDDTCLGNSMETFIPAYLQALGDYLSDHFPPEKLAAALLSSTQDMFANTCPDRTLKDVFDQSFYPQLGIDPKEYQDMFDSFYEEEFPGLQKLTQFRPEAVEVVEEAIRRNYSIVIATNPLFPLTAIRQRLGWAGLDPEKYPFRLIPSYETAFFAKPNPAFYAELLSRLGWPEGPVVMVGDNFEHDIAAARLFGFGTYWVTTNEHPPAKVTDTQSGYGPLKELLSWIDSIPSSDLIPNFEDNRAKLAVLRSSPVALKAFSLELDDVAQWIEHYQVGEWSFTEILCHLRDVDQEINLPRVKKVLRETNPFVPGIDSDKWAEERLYFCQNGQQALKDFNSARIELIDILDGLSVEGWQQPARHAIFGPTNLKELVSIIVGHDRLHVRQAYAAVRGVEA